MTDLGKGAPFTSGEVVDYSSIATGTLIGLAILLGITERGEPGKPQLVRSESDYKKYFGGEIAGTQFPFIVMSALRNGGRYYVIPVAHYEDIEDVSTIDGTAATATLSSTISTVLNSAVFTASSIGTWANDKLKVTVAAAASGNVDLRDIKIELAGYPDLTQTISDVAKNPTVEQKNSFNRLSRFVKLGTVTVSIPEGTVSLIGGARTVANIVDTDYIGSAVSKTGIYSADTIKDAVRISAPELASGAFDKALADYIDMRKDMLGVVRTPLGLDGPTAIEYREGTGSYSHTPVDSWRMTMFTGGLISVNSNGNDVSHSELAHLLVNFANKDVNKSANFSAAGLQRGIIKNVKGVVKDFGTPSNKTEYDLMYPKGINAVIEDYDEQLGHIVRIDGNRTLWKKAQLVQKLNIAEYLIWLYRMINQKVKWQQYEPNDPQMWSYLYSEIKPILNKSIEMRAISSWAYQGDQFAQNKEDATFNALDDLDNGIYKFRPMVKPIGATEWIGYEIGVTNSSVNFETIIN